MTPSLGSVGIVMMTMMALVVPHVLAASCQPSSSYGCLNGYAYNYTTQFACRNEVYSWSSWGCCAQGLVFNSTTSYCCYDGIHDWSDSHCVPWKPKVSATPAGSANTVAAPASAPLNTCQNPNPTPCLTATTEYGCLNGYKYLWETEYPCNCYILSFATHGCCQGEPYSLTNQTCCFDQRTTPPYRVINYAHACEAQAW